MSAAYLCTSASPRSVNACKAYIGLTLISDYTSDIRVTDLRRGGDGKMKSGRKRARGEGEGTDDEVSRKKEKKRRAWAHIHIPLSQSVCQSVQSHPLFTPHTHTYMDI